MPRRTTPRVDTALFSITFSGLGAALLAGSQEWEGPVGWGMFTAGLSSLGWGYVSMMRYLPRPRVPSPGFALSMPRLAAGEFVFEGRQLRGVILESRFRDFCDVAVRRHRHYYHSYRKARMWGGKPRLTKSMVLSARYFVDNAMFTYDEVFDCKRILKQSNLIVGWKVGTGGMLVIVSVDRMIAIAKRQWSPPTLSQIASKAIRPARN